MTKNELIKKVKDLEEERELLLSVLEMKFGVKETQDILDRTKMEYAVIKTNEKLETREWF